MIGDDTTRLVVEPTFIKLPVEIVAVAVLVTVLLPPELNASEQIYK